MWYALPCVCACVRGRGKGFCCCWVPPLAFGMICFGFLCVPVGQRCCSLRFGLDNTLVVGFALGALDPLCLAPLKLASLIRFYSSAPFLSLPACSHFDISMFSP